MENPLIDYKVRAFAEYLGCDPKLAQDIYFELEVSLSLDDENLRRLATWRLNSQHLKPVCPSLKLREK